VARALRRGPVSALRAFLRSGAAGGIVLVVAAVAAMLLANSAAGPAYEAVLDRVTGPVLAAAIGPMTVRLWINDGLMALFFLVVGLEIKRELLDGALTRPADRRLPVAAAAAGMAVPALVYLAVVLAAGRPDLGRGWAVPAATDIAFAVGVMALLGARVPAALKLMLVTVAVVDDLGAVAIIALFYSHGLDAGALAAAAGVLAALFAMNRLGRVRMVWPYMLGFALLWWLVLRSGVHATLAGVLAAAAVPLAPSPGVPDHPHSTLHRLEHALNPWVAFAVVPLFGLANAGVSLAGAGFGALAAAVAAGLFLGKQAGIGAGVALAARTGWAPPPHGVSAAQIWGAGLLGGIGFTMSLFIGGLAFPGDAAAMAEIKLGVLTGSAASALAGYAVLYLSARK